MDAAAALQDRHGDRPRGRPRLLHSQRPGRMPLHLLSDPRRAAAADGQAARNRQARRAARARRPRGPVALRDGVQPFGARRRPDPARARDAGPGGRVASARSTPRRALQRNLLHVSGIALAGPASCTSAPRRMHMVIERLSRYWMLVLLVLASVTVGGCEAIAGIFK